MRRLGNRWYESRLEDVDVDDVLFLLELTKIDLWFLRDFYEYYLGVEFKRD